MEVREMSIGEKRAAALKAKKPGGRKPKVNRPAGKGVGAYSRELIRAGKSNAQVLEMVMKKFPDANTTVSSVSWYRNNMRKEGEKVLSTREANEKSTAKGKKKVV